jgi:hypothetical protein
MDKRKDKSLPRRRRFTLTELRVQQMAWYLWIAEGYLANLRHALQANNFALMNADVRLVKRMIRNQEQVVATIRAEFFPQEG